MLSETTNLKEEQAKEQLNAVKTAFKEQGEAVDVSDVTLDQESVKTLCKLLRPNLQSLNISKCALGVDGCVVFCNTVGKVTMSLLELDMSGNEIQVEGAKAFAAVIEGKNLPQLQTLVISNNSIKGTGGLAIFDALATRQQNLRHFRLAGELHYID